MAHAVCPARLLALPEIAGGASPADAGSPSFAILQPCQIHNQCTLGNGKMQILMKF
jgi:hypothetical protein